uniref:Putative secreted protein n=1 Tax=Anopheles triannulatus TaxID=58253 RepID=A0A2M4B7S5_9DIPT
MCAPEWLFLVAVKTCVTNFASTYPQTHTRTHTQVARTTPLCGKSLFLEKPRTRSLFHLFRVVRMQGQ